MTLAVAAGLAFSSTKTGKSIDGLILDRMAPLLGSPRKAQKAMVILIGEADYEAAQTPLALWGIHLADLLNRIEPGRPEAVGLDLILPQFPLNSFTENHDKGLLKTLNKLSKKCRLVSGYAVEPGGEIKEPFILYQKLLGPKGYGFLNVTPDADGVCRRQALTYLPDSGDRSLYAFSWLLSGVSGQAPPETMPDWRNPDLIPTLTFQQALKADPAEFRDKIVIIGFDFEFEDRHFTPASQRNEPGAITQARVVESLKRGSLLSAPPWPVSLLSPALLMVFLTLLLTERATLFRVIFWGTGMLFLSGAVMIICLVKGIVIRPSAAMTGIVAVCSGRLIQGYMAVKNTFGRYVSREVRDEILSGRIPLDGEMKEVTVLFADLRDFTPMVASTPPKDVVNIINRYFEEMAEAIRQHKGLVLQYIGDEIEAVFGAPVPAPDHRRLAVRAAISMRSRLRVVNQRLVQAGYKPLRHGIGIHTGAVLAGNIGARDRVAYSLVGDTVNLASRIQGLNKQFGTDILISAETKAGMDESIPVQELPPTAVKGKTVKVVIFEVL
ncbi:MAG: adenylate/guanylate cyclase domain-containing protein [Deltaproteobacteria bacterium]|nr:adenylate/guanylate cyclase domain-containing protein [Deltaproteobacteria bacterium]